MIAKELPKKRPNDFTKVLQDVENIISYVKQKGDEALIELEEKFDKVKLASIKFTDVDKLASQISQDLKMAIDLIFTQIYEFNNSIKPPNIIGGSSNGIDYGVIWKSIERVGIYVPGGEKAYPSTLLMAGVPALVAGVKEIYVSSPPTKINPAIAYISLKLGVKEIYTIGGAQAIAAMAYGTQTVKKVDKIVGPGNIYVQAAKYLVSGDVGIDGIEGPTELVIIADENANPSNIVLDLKAQAEHGKSTFLVLLSNSDKIINFISKELEIDPNIYYVIKVNSIDEAIDIANEIAPEHLSLQISNAREYLSKVKNAGAVTLGNTPPAIIDYSAGPNHILPTNGWAKIRGGVSVYDYLKMIMYASTSNPEKKLIESSKILAKYEGFVFHADSIGVRYE
ncbi:histidinol dehydrogenase [Sulfolobus sp. S-194]|uniref:histidinol dehydrogenase n=1 Tax=Sulfolobus sp. S-194 TaxID=2512240 RepID=UPI001436F7C1|nr:histidinol dehydrogenase [Sulfolobus sp. S-194]QIW24343.1 histidinol dehydrogenase [Sulfolobus sp. S-194]